MTPRNLAALWGDGHLVTVAERVDVLEALAADLVAQCRAGSDPAMAQRAETLRLLAEAMQTTLATRKRRRREMDRALANTVAHGGRRMPPLPKGGTATSAGPYLKASRNLYVAVRRFLAAGRKSDA